MPNAERRIRQMSNRVFVGVLIAGVMAAASHWSIGISPAREYPRQVFEKLKTLPALVPSPGPEIIDTHPLEGLVGSPWADERFFRR
jgi:hypothetical protein